MRSVSEFDYIIVGAGPSGLVTAYELQKRGFTSLIVDRDSKVGGLSKSVTYISDANTHIFDTGPKRFHSDDKVVLDFLHEISTFEVIGRSTEVFFSKQFFEWPLKTSQIPKLPIGMALLCAKDLLVKFANARAASNQIQNLDSIAQQPSFKHYILNQYGNTLFETFFRPYTEKFLRWDIEDIHSDWASTGINRTVIDERVDATSIIALLRGILLPQKNETFFLYPQQGGFGNFFEQLYNKISSNEEVRVELILDAELESIDVLNDLNLGVTFKHSSSIYCARKGLIWTGNLNDLSNLLGIRSDLNYLNTVFYDVIVREEEVKRKKAQWTYISDRNSLISRVTSMKEFSKSTTPSGYYNLVAELTDSQLNPRYINNHSAYKSHVLDELKTIGILSNRAKIEAVHSRPVRDTYPIYKLDYKKSFNEVHKNIKQRSHKIHLLGRSGAFWYNNSDHSIRMSLELVKRLVGETSKDFNYRAYFGGKPSH